MKSKCGQVRRGSVDRDSGRACISPWRRLVSSDGSRLAIRSAH